MKRTEEDLQTTDDNSIAMVSLSYMCLSVMILDNLIIPCENHFMVIYCKLSALGFKWVDMI